MSDRYDLVILGSGSTAFAAAIGASELGARVAMVERRTLGGTCVNRGCLPSKNLIEAARLVWDAAHPRLEGEDLRRVDVDPKTAVDCAGEVSRFRQVLADPAFQGCRLADIGLPTPLATAKAAMSTPGP